MTRPHDPTGKISESTHLSPIEKRFDISAERVDEIFTRCESELKRMINRALLTGLAWFTFLVLGNAVVFWLLLTR